MNFDGATLRVAENLTLWWTNTQTKVPLDGARDSAMLFIEALVECEAMTGGDADVWRERVRMARSDAFEPLPELAEAVRSAAAEAVATVEPGTSSISAEFYTAQAKVHALQMLAAVPNEEPAEWYRELTSRIRYPEARAVPDGVRRRMQAIAQTEPGELRRVLAGPFRLDPDMQVTSAEIYDGGLAVRWHYVTHDGRFPQSRGLGRSTVEVADDMGTEYFGRGGGATRLDRVEEREGAVSGRNVFAPAPPSEATVLRVRAGEAFCEVPLAVG
jgi:hypothetical protein